MNISRRKVMMILGRTAGAISAIIYLGPKSHGKIKTEKTEAKKGELLDLLIPIRNVNRMPGFEAA
jgi:hypothetical protein